jgi:hypothetical protein
MWESKQCAHEDSCIFSMRENGEKQKNIEKEFGSI